MLKTLNHTVPSIEVRGKEAISRDKKKLGRVEEIILDKITGQARYAVLSFNSFMGMGADLYSLPWKSLTYSPEYDAFEVHINNAKLKSAKGFAKDNWPNFTAEHYSKSINNFFAM